MSDRPLDGMTIRSASAAPAAELAGYLLTDLGADVQRVPAAEGADLGDFGATAAPAVALSTYGAVGRFVGGPAHHSAVEAVSSALSSQYTYSPGPAYLVSPYATTGQALLAASALLGARMTGAGGLSISELQGLFAIQAHSFNREPDPDRFNFTPRGQSPTYSTYLCADDWIFIGASTTPFMRKVLETLGMEDTLADPRLQDGAQALRHSEIAGELWERIGALVRTRPRDHWLSLFEQVKVPAGPALSMEEALAHPHLRGAGLVEPGEPIGRLANLAAVRRVNDARPRTPETVGPQPLSGLRVVELAGYIAGPYVGRQLVDLGADVVKIEPPEGDPFRRNGNFGWQVWNHGKKGLALNLRDATDRARLLNLVAEADILVTNYRPDALDRMKVGRDDLFAVNPGLIHCSVSAFGETGPLSHLQGFDPVIQAFAGIMKRQGGDGEPVKPQMAATDFLSGMLGALGVMAARTAQLAHGGGYTVSSSLLAAALLLNVEAYEQVRAARPYVSGGVDFKGPHALNGLHEARDGWLLTGLPNAGPADYPDARRFLDGVREATVAEAIGRLAVQGVPAVPSLKREELRDEPHFRENDLWLTLDEFDPEVGPLLMIAPALGPGRDPTPGPRLGEHNDLTDVWAARRLVAG